MEREPTLESTSVTRRRKTTERVPSGERPVVVAFPCRMQLRRGRKRHC